MNLNLKTIILAIVLILGVGSVSVSTVFIYSGKNLGGYTKFSKLARRARVNVDDIKRTVIDVFASKQGKAFTLNMLLTIPELNLFRREQIQEALKGLDKEDKLVKFEVNELHEGESSKNIYLMPRRKLIDEELQREIEQILGEEGIYAVPERTILTFRENLEEVKGEIIAIYIKEFGQNGLKEFMQHVFPRALLLLGDDLESIKSIITADLIWSGDADRKKDLSKFWQSRQFIDEKEILERKKFQPYVKETLKGMVSKLKLQTLEKLNASLGKFSPTSKLIGIMIIGSWGRATPKSYSDLDLIFIVDAAKIVTTFSWENEVHILLSQELNFYQGINLHREIILAYKNTFKFHFMRGGDPKATKLYRTEYILIAKNAEYKEKILRRIQEIQGSN